MVRKTINGVNPFDDWADHLDKRENIRFTEGLRIVRPDEPFERG
jgi:hypothetical protein